MKRSDFRDILANLQKEECGIDATKGEGYANDDTDALANFKRLARLLGLDPLQICCVYMAKHFDAIMSWARLGRDITGENIRGRVVDLRLYAALFYALTEDEDEN